MSSFIGSLFSSVILLVCILEDLRTRKIPNKLILFLFPLALAGGFFLKELSFFQICLSALLSLVITLPLYVGKVIGGGDLKCFFVFAITVTWLDVWQTFFYSLPWVLLFGFVKLVLDKKLKIFLRNLVSILTLKPVEKASLHTIPFSVGLFFGWITLLTLKGI